METIDLSDFFITKAEANAFAQHLTKIFDTIYTAHFDLDKSLMQELGMQKKEALIKLLRENKVQDSSIPALQEFLKKIQDAIATLPLVTLTIAFEPTNETLKAFSQWFLFTLKKQVIFDIHVDTSLVAGATITANGKFKDYSLKALFEKTIEEKPPMQQQTATPTLHQSTEHVTLGR
jgi:F0F1-type ATP synthase delta subunit